ncbi:hypothetical protein [Avibacterium paragallinarum]|uniref:Uncharacterized protein n=3 Tax=Avibacterium paragallinarum TaxID=728 RepID=A0AAE5TG01_AVIPA|nr:hypothetical protein [Avibacterium paragallinarum]MEE3609391.1 hypothetical protein [Avibacterium paragallinarum]MEE3622205.1 hypothetical protein [Avibacterium paragallinarum]MEE3669959.1 hypothetical protein [Avibacterium paragallinarum]MEE3682065.1 hypothetical protein [Avibacterium paragallinarum]MEE4386646.1 hypothetical protein [Avibacterium paragallinarum]
MNTTQLLNEREKTHGDFVSGAETFYYLMKPIIDSQLFERNKVAAYAMTMIQAKVTRICNGDESFPDHWEDIIGYASLALGKQFEPQQNVLNTPVVDYIKAQNMTPNR